jgi:hypothetical protein
MGTAWGLVLLGAVLVYVASRPIRARASSSRAVATPPPSAPPAQPKVSADKPSRSRTEDTITPPWLDSLIGSDTQPASQDPLDDAESIASVLRLWLSEDAK